MTRHDALLILLASSLTFAASAANAAWTLDNDASEISFVTIKAQDVAEVHRFATLSGAVDEAGVATVNIELASVDTLIPIRDERMREMLFETDLFPTATVRAQIDPAWQTLALGASVRADAEVMLELHDEQVPLTAELLVSRLAEDRMLIATLKPVVVNSGSVNLTEGVEALREIAGLPSISKAVPVSIVLTYVDR